MIPKVAGTLRAVALSYAVATTCFSQNANAMDPLTVAAIANTTAGLIDSMNSGANPMAVTVMENHRLLVNIQGRITELDKTLHSALAKIDQLPAHMRMAVRTGFDEWAAQQVVASMNSLRQSWDGYQASVAAAVRREDPYDRDRLKEEALERLESNVAEHLPRLQDRRNVIVQRGYSNLPTLLAAAMVELPMMTLSGYPGSEITKTGQWYLTQIDNALDPAVELSLTAYEASLKEKAEIFEKSIAKRVGVEFLQPGQFSWYCHTLQAVRKVEHFCYVWRDTGGGILVERPSTCFSERLVDIESRSVNRDVSVEHVFPAPAEGLRTFRVSVGDSSVSENRDNCDRHIESIAEYESKMTKSGEHKSLVGDVHILNQITSARAAFKHLMSFARQARKPIKRYLAALGDTVVPAGTWCPDWLSDLECRTVTLSIDISEGMKEKSKVGALQERIDKIVATEWREETAARIAEVREAQAASFELIRQSVMRIEDEMEAAANQQSLAKVSQALRFVAGSLKFYKAAMDLYSQGFVQAPPPRPIRAEAVDESNVPSKEAGQDLEPIDSVVPVNLMSKRERVVRARELIQELKTEGLDTTADWKGPLTPWEEKLVRAHELVASLSGVAHPGSTMTANTIEDIAGVLGGGDTSSRTGWNAFLLGMEVFLRPERLADGTLTGPQHIEDLRGDIEVLSRQMIEFREGSLRSNGRGERRQAL